MQLATASSRDTCKPASREKDRVWDKGKSVGFVALWLPADRIELPVPKRALSLKDSGCSLEALRKGGSKLFFPLPLFHSPEPEGKAACEPRDLFALRFLTTFRLPSGSQLPTNEIGQSRS